MKILVEVKYLDFVFTDVEEAVEFAKLVNKTYRRDEDEVDKEIVTVTITEFNKGENKE